MRRARLAAIAALALLIAPGHWWRSPVVADTTNAVRFARLPVTTPEDWPDGLTIEQAWHLDAANTAFAGFSALALDGEGFTAFSDFGGTARFPRPAGQILRLPVTPLPRSAAIAYTPDVEAAAHDPASGTTWVAYEFHNAIRRIDRAGKSTFARPAQLRQLGLNSGIEAMARLPDGRFLMLSERSQQGFLFAGDPVEGGAPLAFHVEPHGEYRPTDMAALPGGRVLVLLRALEWGIPPFASMLAVGDPAAIRAGEVWALEPLAVIDQPGLRENYEGLAVETAPDGALILWLISDNNRSALQRTLLLKLRWETQTAREANPASR
jgi:hypothetical protein